MKNTDALSFALLGLMMTLVACDKPKQREETIDKEIQEQLVEVSALHDISSETTKAYFYTSTNKNGEIERADKTAQIKADENVMRALSMIKKPETKIILDAQLASGLIGFVVMPGKSELKVYKVLTKAEASADQNANLALDSLEIKKMKKSSLETAHLKMAAADIDLEEAKNDVRYIEIASIKITKAGVLENKKTKYYDEKTSILTVGERPADVSTHLLLEPDIKEEKPKP